LVILNDGKFQSPLMNKKYFLFSCSLLIAIMCLSNGTNQLRGNGMQFIENKGQVVDMNSRLRPDILFSGEGGGSKVFLRGSGVSYVIAKQEYSNAETTQDSSSVFFLQRIDMDFEGANNNITILKSEMVEGYFNYYLPHCANGITKVSAFNKVVYENVYPGIDVVFFGSKEQGLKYDIVIRPGANPNDISLKYTGANGIEIDPYNSGGQLKIKSSFGEMTERIPKVYQNVKGEIVDVKAEYVLDGSTVNFKLGTFNSAYSLTIDPWISYYGGVDNDIGAAIAVDPSGNVLFTGSTWFTNTTGFPVTPGSFQTTAGAFGDDAFVVKMDGNGMRMWATYFGGAANDRGRDITTDGVGNVFVSGLTGSNNLPIAATAGYVVQQNTFGGSFDAFLVSFDPTGALLWGTFLGDVADDRGTGIVTDGSNVYLYGSTQSSTGISAGAVAQPIYGGSRDMFVAKFGFTGSLTWCTYVGGSSAEDPGDICYDNASGTIYVSGTTGNTFVLTPNNFPVLSGHQMLSGGFTDAFLMKLDANGICLWSTFYGGANKDNGNGVAVDKLGNVILVGNTNSIDVNAISVAGAYQLVLGGMYDGYLAKFNGAGLRLWGSYLGGNNSDAVFDLGVDINNNIYVYGEVEEADLGNYPLSACAYQTSYGGVEDQFFAKYDANGTQHCISYLGGTREDEFDGRQSGMALVGNSIYFSGTTLSSTSGAIDYPVTTGAFQTVAGGGWDIFVGKLCINLCESKNLGLDFAANQTNVCSGTAVTFSLSVNNSCDTSGYTFSWSFTGANISSSSAINPSVSYSVPGTYPVKCVLTTLCKKDSITKASYITVQGPSILANSISNISCFGMTNGSVSINPTGGTAPYTYLWSNLQTGQAISNLSVGNYTCVVSDNNSCATTYTVTISSPAAIFISPIVKPDTCSNGVGNMLAAPNGGMAPFNYLWSNGGTNSSITGMVAGIYSVTVTDANNCSKISSSTILNLSGPTAFAGSSLTIQQGGTAMLSGSGGNAYSWSPSMSLSCSNCPNPVASPLETTMYFLVVTDANGCTSIDTVMVYVEIGCGKIFVPSAFSPNGDGENDLFSLYADAICIKRMFFYIYDRWGEKVFEATRPEEKWDGYYRGKLLNTNVFTYHIYAETTNGQTISQKGNISLIR